MEEKKTLGILSLVFSIASIVCCGGGGIFAITGIILAFVEKSKKGQMSSMAKTGLIIGIVSMVIGMLIGAIFGAINAVNPTWLADLINEMMYF